MHRSLLVALLLTAALVLAACGGDDEAAVDAEPDTGDGDVEVTVEGEDGEDVTVRGEEDEDGGMSAEVESEDGTVGLDAGNLPDEWPDEWPVPDDVEVSNMFTLEDDDALMIQGMLAHTGGFDAAIAYLEGLTDEGWDVTVSDESDEFMDRANVEIEGFGWGGEIEVVEAPNAAMNITLIDG